MKKIAMLLFLSLGVIQLYGSADSLVQVKLDSIFAQVAEEEDQRLRIQLTFSIYRTSIEDFPHLFLYCHQKLINISEQNGSPVDEALAWTLAGHAYRLSGNYILALEYHNKAVALAEKAGDPAVLGYTRILMGHLYKDKEQYRKALDLYLAAHRIEQKEKVDSVVVRWAENNLGSVYLMINELDSCLYYDKNKIYPKSRAGAYSKMGRYQEAEKLYHICVQADLRKGTTRNLTRLYLDMAEHFQRSARIDSAAWYARVALGSLEDTKYHYVGMKAAELLANIYLESNADSALKYLKIYSAANDSLNSTRSNHQFEMLTYGEELRQRNMAQEKIEYENRIQIYALFAALGIFGLIVLILINNNKQKQKANKLLGNTLNDLKSTQAQLIQSEKMASLGELTAGIAHEIQNPLNFVNNFSEVSNELIDEMQDELAKGDVEEAKAISADIKQNLEKITHHGKRADAIVKGMLAHSRSGKGEKELADLNALAEEYLKLSYHGLRAKDKSFNAEFKTNFDPDLPKVLVVPQDIGRVLLNLINNAFQAVNERSKKSEPGYKPEVSVETKVKTNNQTLITIRDNGTGIPDSIKEKIFQPFFTTKPTGQGTGLGLSLSYDIVRAHGGELKAESTQGQGTRFTVLLPIK